MEKCPKCERWTLSLNPIRNNVYCYNCGYEDKLDYNEYRRKNDLLPKLLKSLELNGYKI